MYSRYFPPQDACHPLSPEEEKALRRKLVERALEALTTEVEDQTIFEV